MAEVENDADRESRGLPEGEMEGFTDGVPVVESEGREDSEGEGVSVCVALRRPMVALTEGEGEAREPVGAGEAEPVTLEDAESEGRTVGESDTEEERDAAAAEGVASAPESEALGDVERESVGEGDCDGEPLALAERVAPDTLPPNRDAVGETLAERDTDTEPVLDADCESQAERFAVREGHMEKLALHVGWPPRPRADTLSVAVLVRERVEVVDSEEDAELEAALDPILVAVRPDAVGEPEKEWEVEGELELGADVEGVVDTDEERVEEAEAE